MKADTSNTLSLEPGVWDARVLSLIDLGWHDTPAYGLKHQVFITFETEQVDEYGKGKTISSFFSLTLNDKSNLSKLILGIFGKLVPQEKKADFDFRCLIDKPVQLTVIEEPRKNGEGTKLTIINYGYIKNDRDSVCPLSREKQFFDLDEPDWDVYESFSDWIKEKINLEKPDEAKKNHHQNTENSAKAAKPESKPQPEQQDAIPDFDDDIPF